MRINDLIKELQDFADQYGNIDMHFRVYGDNSDMYGEEVKAVINAYGDNISGGLQARMRFTLEDGCKITTSKELKEKRRTGNHYWTARDDYGDYINDSSFERRTKRFGNPNNGWSTMTEDNC